MKYIVPRLVSRISVVLVVLGSVWNVQAQLNQSCTISVLNRNVQVNPDGTWVLANIPANQGRVRARATCILNGLTRFGQSDRIYCSNKRLSNSATHCLRSDKPHSKCTDPHLQSCEYQIRRIDLTNPGSGYLFGRPFVGCQLIRCWYQLHEQQPGRRDCLIRGRSACRFKWHSHHYGLQ